YVDELLRALVRQRLQEHRIDDAEHRTVGADAEAQREHDEEREGRAAQGGLQRIADVLEHGLEPRFLTKDKQGVRERPQRAKENRGGRASVESVPRIAREDPV